MIPMDFKLTDMEDAFFLRVVNNDTPAWEPASGLSDVFPILRALPVLSPWSDADRLLEAASAAVSEEGDLVGCQRFLNASREDQLAYCYAACDGAYPYHYSEFDRATAVDAWFVYQMAKREREAVGLPPLDWPPPMIQREAMAAQSTVLQRCVFHRMPPTLFPHLVAWGEDAAARDARGATALHWAASIYNQRANVDAAETIRTLLELGADLEARDKFGRSPLDIALYNRNATAMQRELVRAGAMASSPMHLGFIFRYAESDGWEDVLLAREAELDRKALEKVVEKVRERPTKLRF